MSRLNSLTEAVGPDKPLAWWDEVGVGTFKLFKISRVTRYSISKAAVSMAIRMIRNE